MAYHLKYFKLPYRCQSRIQTSTEEISQDMIELLIIIKFVNVRAISSSLPFFQKRTYQILRIFAQTIAFLLLFYELPIELVRFDLAFQQKVHCPSKFWDQPIKREIWQIFFLMKVLNTFFIALHNSRIQSYLCTCAGFFLLALDRKEEICSCRTPHYRPKLT